jgi:hypothetical protein
MRNPCVATSGVRLKDEETLPMRSIVRPELVTALLEAAGVAPDAARPDAAAAWVGAQLEGTREAFDALAFEDEPAGFALEMHRQAR